MQLRASFAIWIQRLEDEINSNQFQIRIISSNDEIYDAILDICAELLIKASPLRFIKP